MIIWPINRVLKGESPNVSHWVVPVVRSIQQLHLYSPGNNQTGCSRLLVAGSPLTHVSERECVTWMLLSQVRVRVQPRVQTPVCRQNFLHFCWQRFNKALKTFLRDLVRVDMISSWCKFPVPPHPKFYLLDLRIVIWLLIPLEALVIRWAHCGYKGMDVVR